MMNKIDPFTLSCETLQDGTLAVKTTEPLMLLAQNRYKELAHIEQLFNAMDVVLDEKHQILEQDRRTLKTKCTADRRAAKDCTAKCSVEKKLTEYNCIVEEFKELRSQNTELLIELSKYTALSRETLSGPLKSMIRDLREQGVGIKEIHIRIKRQINPDISYSMVRKYISEIESESN